MLEENIQVCSANTLLKEIYSVTQDNCILIDLYGDILLITAKPSHCDCANELKPMAILPRDTKTPRIYHIAFSKITYNHQ